MPPVATLLSYSDLIDHLVGYAGGDAIDRGKSDYRQAIQVAYTDLALGNEWRTYLTRGRINLNALQDDGTITVDVTGGSYERMVTITDNTWPSWAPYGTLLIDGVRYKVDELKSNTILTLTYDSCPTADVVAGTSYTLYQNVYPLPEDFRRLEGMHYEQGRDCLVPLMEGVADWTHLDQQEAVSGRPLVYSIGGSPDAWQYGKMSLYVHPYPDTAESIDFTYWRNPRPLKITGFGTNDRIGTVTGTAASTTVTGTSTQFHARMIGSLIRFGDTTNYPEGMGGLNPYSEQRVITGVTSTTSITVNEALTYSYTGVKYIVTDPVDADGALLIALYRNAEMQLDNFRQPARMPVRAELYQRAYLEAMERDQRVMPTFGLYGALWESGGTLIVSTEDDDDDDGDTGGGTTTVPELLFSQTEIKTVASTDSESALSGTGEGSLTVAANTWGVGDVIRIHASGTYGTQTPSAGTLTLRLNCGSTVLHNVSMTMPDAQVGKSWTLDASLTRHSIGAGGTVSGVGLAEFSVDGEASRSHDADPVENDTLDSTIAQTISLTADWETASASNTITCSQLTVELLEAS